MNGSIRSFERILDRFKFRQPLPGHVQNYVLAQKRKALVEVLKTVDDYSAYYGVVLGLYFTTRRVGIKITVARSKLILAVSALITTAVIILASWYLSLNRLPSKTIIMDKPSASGFAVPGPTTEKVHPDDKMIDDNTAPSVKYRLGVDTFTSDIADKRERNRIADSITQELIRLKGKEKIVRLGKSGRKNVNRILLGSVEKLGDTIIITARIVDVEKSRVLFTASESSDSPEGVQEACVLIARKAASSME